MKFILSTFLVFFFILSHSYSQDIIFMLDGEEIEAKVTEVQEEKIKYKKYSNLDGPTYYLDKANIFMIKYENGEKDVFIQKEKSHPITNGSKDNNSLKRLLITRQGIGLGKDYFIDKEEVSRKGFKNFLKVENQESYLLFKKGNNKILGGKLMFFPSAAILGIHTILIIPQVNAGRLLPPTGVAIMTASAGTGLALIILGELQIKKSMEIYNTDLKKDTGLYFDVNGNGIGLSYRF